MPSKTVEGPPLLIPTSETVTCAGSRSPGTCHPQSFVTQDGAHSPELLLEGPQGFGTRAYWGVEANDSLFQMLENFYMVPGKDHVALFSDIACNTCGSRYSEGVLATLAAVLGAGEPDSSPHRSGSGCSDRGPLLRALCGPVL